MAVQSADPEVIAASARVDDLRVAAFRVPLGREESDGTFTWDALTFVLVEADAGGLTGIGYSYTHPAAARLIHDDLAGIVVGMDAMRIGGCWDQMHRAVRNIGRPGIGASAISAVDAALWDLKARLLSVSVADLLPSVRTRILVYASGGFTSYSEVELQRRMSEWVEQGIRMVKMKVGGNPDEDIRRVRLVRERIGPDVELFVDANGAYGRKSALGFAYAFADLGVTWFEEPVSSDDLEGLRLVRDNGPPAMDITAGEYGYDLFYFRRMLDAGAVDVLQADATRCGGISGMLGAGKLCEARAIDLSAHTAPALHAHVCCAVAGARHVEYFRDHVEIENTLFDGTSRPVDGALQPDRSRPGFGIEFKWQDAERYRV